MFSLPYPSPEDNLSGGIGVPRFTTTLTTAAPLDILVMAVGSSNRELAEELGGEFASSILKSGAAGAADACQNLAQRLASETNLTPEQAGLLAAMVNDAFFTTREPIQEAEKAIGIKSSSHSDRLKSSDYRDWIDENGIYVIPKGTTNLNPLHFPVILKMWWDTFGFEEIQVEDNRFYEPSVFSKLPKAGVEGDREEDGSFTQKALGDTFGYWIVGVEDCCYYEAALDILRDEVAYFIPDIPYLKEKYNKILENFGEVVDIYLHFINEHDCEFLPGEECLTNKYLRDIQEEIANELALAENAIDEPNTKDEGDLRILNKHFSWVKDNERYIEGLYYHWQETRQAAQDFMTCYLEYEAYGLFEKIKQA